MSYRYNGMVKKASAQQVEQLAVMLKIASLAKREGLPVLHGVNTGRGPSRIIGALFGGGHAVNNGNLLPPGESQFLKQLAPLGKGTLKYGLPAAGLAGAGFFGGRETMRGPLNSALQQNERLRNQSGWAKLWRQFKEWLASFGKKDTAPTK